MASELRIKCDRGKEEGSICPGYRQIIVLSPPSPPLVILAAESTTRARHKFSFAGQQMLTKSPAINFARAFPRVILLPGFKLGENSTRAGSSRELRRIYLHRSPSSHPRSPMHSGITSLKLQVGFGAFIRGIKRSALQSIVQLLAISDKLIRIPRDTLI